MSTLIKKFWAASMLVMSTAITLTPAAAVLAEDNASTESTVHIEFWGQLQELSSTELPTTIIVRENPTGEFTDYTVDLVPGTAVSPQMDWWITGDTVHVIGVMNENTGVVTADGVINSSINPWNHRGLNGWITEIDEDEDTMTVQWNNVEHVVNITDDTHMVVPPVNPAALSDFEIGDRVRLRLDARTDENDARIIVALRRGDHIYLKARTRGFSAELTDIDDNGDGTGELTVTLLHNEHLRQGDVNNLIGLEGDELTITYDDFTKFVRRYNGETEVSELVEGDILFIVGRYNDDETISARLIKDVNIWRLGVARKDAEVESIDTSANTMIIDVLDQEGNVVYGDITIQYTDETEFYLGGEEVSEDDVEDGDIIHIRGTARLVGGVYSISSIETIGIESDEE